MVIALIANLNVFIIDRAGCLEPSALRVRDKPFQNYLYFMTFLIMKKKKKFTRRGKKRKHKNLKKKQL